ncbi:PepSY domain-containing protein [Stenotrophomonas sp. SI-NJAU-1]|uniref:PepSY-associated TM helix domain-containing protein n=1 Tax=Stenotrophomonas TaxID=40323 RepID=UPI001AA0EF79|nr:MULTISPECIES: PepSY-associated TM helix domain-containing protein [Stenotrophomonas]MBO1746263.1 PepSY domain-containing protein [Stenotrophomonas indicatrix]UEX17079.1 PepSY domain-containing protein [Stenotrophomonas sp. SI-NJAU-1]
MKFSSQTLRTFTTLHTWVGLVAGFGLFVAFYAGALTLFHHDLPLWQTPGAATALPASLDDAQYLLDDVLATHADARRHVGMTFPGADHPQPLAYWQAEDGSWRYAWPGQISGSPTPPQTGLAELVNELHYSLGLPVAGVYVMGIVSLLYGMALLSGLVIHLPKLLGDLFALRPGRNLKQQWQDAHNVIGVLSLPFHLMFAVTGTLLCLVFMQMAVLDPLIYDGKALQAVPTAMDTAPLREASGIPAAPGSLRELHARALEVARAQGVANFEPAYLKLANGGDANATIEITGEASGTLGPLGAVALDVESGRLLASQLPGQRDANHATLSAAYALHFGEFGNGVVVWLYFLLGLGGAFLFYSGNLLWIESRRKRRQPQQSRAAVNMARATVGVCIGLCVAISVAFVAALVLEQAAPAMVDHGIRWACFVTWAACALWATLRRPAQAARELLWAAAISTALVPLAHGALSGDWLWLAAARGHWPLFWIDAMALAMAVGFARLAVASQRRARSGDPNSVWAN